MFSVILSTTPERDTATTIARDLVERGLVACANIVKIRSIYLWKGQVHDEGEWLMVLKTKTSLVKRVIDAIVERHPYDVPEVVSFRISEAYLPYLNWIAEVTLD